MIHFYTCPLYWQSTRFPKNPAFIEDQTIYSYAEIEVLTQQWVYWLQQKDLKPGSIVGSLYLNGVCFYALLFACIRLRAILFPLNTYLSIEQVETRLKEENISLILSNQKLSLDHEYITLKKLQSFPYIPYQPKFFSTKQPITWLMTSGSTSKPKICQHILHNHFISASMANHYLNVTCSSYWLLNLPIYHVSGLSILFRMCLAGGCIIFDSTKTELSHLISTYKITHLSLVPTQLRRLLDTASSFPSVQVFLVGGAPLNKTLLERALKANLPIYPTYGLTETSSQIATSFQNTETLKLLPIVDIKIIEGELYVKGPTLFSGYIEQGNLIPSTDEEGYFATKDLASLHYASIKIEGRKDNLFISGGENIQPEEIEKVLLSFDEIEKAVVIPKEDEEFGARPIAFVDGSFPDIQSFFPNLSKFLPKYKHPIAYYPLPDKFKQTLKPNRKELKKYFETYLNYKTKSNR